MSTENPLRPVPTTKELDEDLSLLPEKQDPPVAISKPVYKPGMIYSWDTSSFFPVSGPQLNVLHHLIHSIINEETTPKQAIIYAHEASKVVEALIKDGVERGLITQKDPNKN